MGDYQKDIKKSTEELVTDSVNAPQLKAPRAITRAAEPRTRGQPQPFPISAWMSIPLAWHASLLLDAHSRSQASNRIALNFSLQHRHQTPIGADELDPFSKEYLHMQYSFQLFAF